MDGEKNVLFLPTLFIQLGTSSYENTFRKPDKTYYPETWFHFIGGNVSKEGITADLEAIAAAGISGIQLFHGQFGGEWPGVSPQIKCLSESWDDLILWTAEECKRLDLRFTMQNCPGWSYAGGPWIEPDNAMRQLARSRTDIDGGQKADYLARCNYMLESGKPVSDVLMYLGDEQNHKPQQSLDFPEGYAYDYCNPDVLLNRLTVENGRMVTPEGISYGVLWLYDCKRMLPETLEKIHSFVQQGITVVGEPPAGIATLSGGTAAESRFQKVVDALWGKAGGDDRESKPERC